MSQAERTTQRKLQELKEFYPNDHLYNSILNKFIKVQDEYDELFRDEESYFDVFDRITKLELTRTRIGFATFIYVTLEFVSYIVLTLYDLDSIAGFSTLTVPIFMIMVACYFGIRAFIVKLKYIQRSSYYRIDFYRIKSTSTIKRYELDYINERLKNHFETSDIIQAEKSRTIRIINYYQIKLYTPSELDKEMIFPMSSLYDISEYEDYRVEEGENRHE